MDNLFVQAISKVRQKVLFEMIEEVVVAARMHDYEFDQILEALVEYARRREDWGEVATHLADAKDSVIEAKGKIVTH